MTVKTFRVCIAHEPDRLAAWIGLDGGAPRVLGGIEGADRKAASVLKALKEEGVCFRVERLAAGNLSVEYVRLRPEDPRYPLALAREFRTRGWEARVCAPAQAEVWRRLYTLPLAPAIRRELLAVLDAAGAAAIEELSSMLDKAEKELQAA